MRSRTSGREHHRLPELRRRHVRVGAQHLGIRGSGFVHAANARQRRGEVPVEPVRVRPRRKRSLIEGDGLLEVALHLVRRADADPDVEVHRVERAQPQRALELLDRLERAVRIDVGPRQPAPGPGGVGIDGDRPLEQDAGGAEVVQEGVHGPEHGQDQRVVAAELGPPLGQLQRQRLALFDIRSPRCRPAAGRGTRRRARAPAGSPDRCPAPCPTGPAPLRSPPPPAPRRAAWPASHSRRRPGPAAACAASVRSRRCGSRAAAPRPPAR